jgi:hypothetical protein
VVADADIVVAALPCRRCHRFDRIAAVARHRVGAQIHRLTANFCVAHLLTKAPRLRCVIPALGMKTSYYVHTGIPLECVNLII